MILSNYADYEEKKLTFIKSQELCNLKQQLHLKQLEFPYCVCRPFTKDRERIQKCRKTGNL